MARILGSSTLLPNASNEQSVNIGITATWVTITVTGNDAYPHRSEGKATASYQHCQSLSTNKSTNEPGYLVRLYDSGGSIIASAKFKSFTTGLINLKEISVSGTHQMLIEAGN